MATTERADPALWWVKREEAYKAMVADVNAVLDDLCNVEEILTAHDPTADLAELRRFTAWLRSERDMLESRGEW